LTQSYRLHNVKTRPRFGKMLLPSWFLWVWQNVPLQRPHPPWTIRCCSCMKWHCSNSAGRRTHSSSCYLSGHSREAQELANCDLRIWDEATIALAHALSTKDRLLRGISNLDIPFSGKGVLLGEDFKQTLPVIRHANRAAITESTIRHLPVWSSFRHFHR